MQGVLWAVLKNKETNKLFGIASTHFWWKAEGKQDELQCAENAKDAAEICRNI